MTRRRGAGSRVAGALSRWARPAVRVAGREVPAFGVAVALGIPPAVGLGVLVAIERGLSAATMLGIAVVAFASEGALSWSRRALGLPQRFVFYRSFWTVALGVGAFLYGTGAPLLEGLESVLLGVGLLQAISRSGCFMAGCCHGRPCAWGVRYGEAHARAGFDPHLVGVPLLPVQLLEMGWSLLSVAVGAGVVFAGAAPGGGLAAYVVTYACGRFFLELARGDALRGHRGGLSEAQWTALGTTTVVVAAGSAGALPASGPHAAAWAALLVAAVWAVARSRRPSSALLQPSHLRELARAARVLGAGAEMHKEPGAPPHVIRTSMGVELACHGAGSARWIEMRARLSGDRDARAGSLTSVVRSLLEPVGLDLHASGSADPAWRHEVRSVPAPH